MSKKKQIEEMAKVVEKMPWRIEKGEGLGCRITNNIELAEYFYNEGYRKQSEGNDMITCKIKPRAGECSACVDTANYYGQLPDCSKCAYNTERYAILGITSGIFTDYAFVRANEKIQKVNLNRVYDVKGGANQ